jgi:hypothetical protein
VWTLPGKDGGVYYICIVEMAALVRYHGTFPRRGIYFMYVNDCVDLCVYL